MPAQEIAYRNAAPPQEAAVQAPSAVDVGSNSDRLAAMSQASDISYRNRSDGSADRGSDVAYRNGGGAYCDELTAGQGSDISYRNPPSGSLGYDPIVGDLADWMAPDAGPAPGTSRMPERFRGEDQRFQQSRFDENKQSTVHYLTPQEASASKVSTRDGTILGPDGNGLTTTGSHEVLADAMEDANIWAMSPQGEMRHTDPKPRDIDAQRQEVTHHSSLFSGEDVKCAGEMKVEDGFLKEINNRSGHYAPSDRQLLAAVGEMSDQKINTDLTKVHEVNSNHEFFGAEYLATQGDADKADQKRQINQQIKGFDKSTLRKPKSLPSPT